MAKSRAKLAAADAELEAQSVSGSKCTGKNYTGRLWGQFLGPSFVSSFAQVSTATPESPFFESLVESCQDFSHPSVTLVENCQDLTTLAATL
jgi:hypothetical protein